MVRRGGGADGDDAGGHSQSVNVRISRKMDNVVTILFQNRASDFFNGRLDLSKINWMSNPGHVLDAALSRIGLQASPSGKSLWWTAEPSGPTLHWRAPAKAHSRAPAEQRATALGGLDNDLEHDAGEETAATRAADAARPQPLRALSLQPPTLPDDRFGKHGTGYGNLEKVIA